jgi:hypothetical protein
MTLAEVAACSPFSHGQFNDLESEMAIVSFPVTWVPDKITMYEDDEASPVVDSDIFKEDRKEFFGYVL